MRQKLREGADFPLGNVPSLYLYIEGAPSRLGAVQGTVASKRFAQLFIPESPGWLSVLASNQNAHVIAHVKPLVAPVDLVCSCSFAAVVAALGAGALGGQESD